MAQVQVTTKMRYPKRRDAEPSVVMQIHLLPRGSGNRNTARRLGEHFRRHELLGDHITRIRVGSSSLSVHFRPTIDAMQACLEWHRLGKQRKLEDEAGQLRFA